MNLYKVNVKYKAMNLHSKFYILFVHNRRKMTKNLTFEQTSESILTRKGARGAARGATSEAARGEAADPSGARRTLQRPGHSA